MDFRLSKPVVAAAKYFVVFFMILLGYGFFDAQLVKHVPFEFDLTKNLGVPAFTALVGYVTTAFRRPDDRGGM